MAVSYHCFSCRRVFLGITERKCPPCGGTNGELLLKERVEDGVESGTFYDIDLKTGKRAKKRK